MIGSLRVAIRQFREAVRPIVYGVFGLGFFVYVLGGSVDRLFFAEALPAPTFGTPEPSLVSYGAAQLARRLGLPFRTGGSLCASKLADAQAAYESANTLNSTIMAGTNFVLHAAGWLEMAWHLYQWGDAVEVIAPEGLRALVENYRRNDFDALP